MLRRLLRDGSEALANKSTASEGRRRGDGTVVQSIQYDAFNQMHDDSIGKELHELVEWSLLDSCRLRRMIPHALGREYVGFRGKGAHLQSPLWRYTITVCVV